MPENGDPNVEKSAAGVLPAAAQGGPISHGIARVARVHRMIASHLLRRVGLYPPQELVMMILWDMGPQRQVDLIGMLNSDAATMTRTIRRLEHAGFVRRAPCADDKRSFTVEPTAASRALRTQVEEVWKRLEDTAVGGVSEEERRTILRVLEGLEERLTAAAAELHL